MADNPLINKITEWLVDQALSEPDIVEMFEGLCRRLHATGIPVARARLTWPTLHPLFQAETVLWQRNVETEFEQFNHREASSDDWLQSPMKYMLDNNVDHLRRRLEGPDKLIDFPVLEELEARGLTDYLSIITAFTKSGKGVDEQVPGIIVAWSPNRSGGFTDDDITALQRIQRRFALACKTAIQSRIARNLTETYLGTEAGRNVLAGQIRRGDGEETCAVVWYNDLRNSTGLADHMPSEDYLRMLNEYFEATAGPVIEAGGQVLDFIGDAVLAIFPYDSDEALPAAAALAVEAAEKSLQAVAKVNTVRKRAGEPLIKFGIGLNIGTVMFGNIGVPQRLSFSVIGPTVNEVARIEDCTKMVDTDVLVTAGIAALHPEKWVSNGVHVLKGVADSMELFTLKSQSRGKNKMKAKRKPKPVAGRKTAPKPPPKPGANGGQAPARARGPARV